MNDFDNIDNQLPYNPSDVDIRQQKFSVGHIVEMIAQSDIELWRVLDYQRKSTSWDTKQKSRLVESLIMRIPLPIFYFDGSDKPWKVIDGLHRLTSFYSFMTQPGFELKELEYLKNLEGLDFFRLPFQYRRIIEQSIIEAYVINPGTPDKVKLNIFQRINTGGSSLSRQEIRNAYYRGTPVDFIDALANTAEFSSATNGKIPQSKMRDKEAVLRFFSFFKYLEKYNPPMERFLDISMENISQIDEKELYYIKNRFRKSMLSCSIIFGDNAFYILNVNGERQSTTINVALFEAWAVNLALLTDEALDILHANCDAIVYKFIILLQNVEFHKSFSSSTSSKKAVYTRFSAIKELLNSVINAS
ncbi:MAG: DUF262 domain-containing protein [Bacteroidota bacterium]